MENKVVNTLLNSYAVNAILDMLETKDVINFYIYLSKFNNGKKYMIER